MKKLLSILLILVMSLTLLAGCGRNETPPIIPEGPGLPSESPEVPNNTSEINISAIEMVKLLLANERLDKDILSAGDDIFETNSDVLRDLSDKAIENLTYTVPEDQFNVGYMTLASGTKYRVLSLVDTTQNGGAPSLDVMPVGSFGEEKTDIGKMEINGDTVTFSEFEEVSNSYEYFLNLTNNIVLSAELAADMIDFVKKNIRVVGKWVEIGNAQYYLHVGENEELMCEVSTESNMIDICRRYKNEDGVDVYELYRESSGYKTRMTYIPGQRYEISMDDVYFTADNSKGYWISYVVGDMNTHYNISYLVLKDDICFTFGIDLDQSTSMGVEILSPDRQTDIMTVEDLGLVSWFKISLCAFDGIEKITAPKEDVNFAPDYSYGNCSGSNNIVIHTTSGKSITVGTKDEVQVSGINVMYMAYGYVPEIFLSVEGETKEERHNKIYAFLNENGLTCRRDIDEVKSGIDRAIIDRDSIIKYYTWNGENVSTKAGVRNAVAKERARYDEMYALYTAVKDVELISYDNREVMELNMSFPTVTSISVQGIGVSGGEITVDSVILMIDDTTLIVENEPYKVGLALQTDTGSLIHLEQSSTSAVEYSGEGSFSVAATDISIVLPKLASGHYELVAYIATSDGIRSSKSISVPFESESIDGMPVVMGNMELTAFVNNVALILTYTEKLDVYAELSSATALSFADFDTMVREYAFNYGFTEDSSIEMKDEGEAYVLLSGETEVIVDGEYRIAYSVVNGETIRSGYVYISYDYLEPQAPEEATE